MARDLYHIQNFSRTDGQFSHTWEGAILIADKYAKETGKSAEIKKGSRRWVFWDGVATPCWKMGGE